MNLLYILGKGSKFNDIELRYSLRSVEKHLHGVDRTIIVGERPDWITNIEHYYTPDFRYIKAANAIYKIKAACSIPGNEEFLLMNDDFFFTKDTSVTYIPLYWYRSLRWLHKSFSKNSSYVLSIRRTEEYLQDYGHTTTNFELHYPMPIISKIMMNILEEDFSAGYHARSLYGNIAPAWTHRHSEKKDMKIDRALNKQQTYQKILGNGMFSIGDNWLMAEGKSILESMYPEKSKYELCLQ